VNILLLGPQGSGKGTQAKLISADYGVPHIATGEMLRQSMDAGTEFGRKVKPIYDAGLLVPDDLMIDIIRERLGADDTAEGFILDGFPRTLAQADALDAMLREIGRELDIVFEFQLPDEIAIARLSKRAADEGRSDDTPDAIRTRLELYHRETEPLVEHYRIQGNLVGIHAARSIDEVYSEIQDALDQVAVK
jgi:adenylate kinase